MIRISNISHKPLKVFKPILTASVNKKGVIDIDTVKGCSYGIKKYPKGCYDLCYAYRLAIARGYDFSRSVSRKIINSNITNIESTLINNPAPFFRIGTMGDPSHDWDLTIETCNWLSKFKTPVIVSKHWESMSNDHIKQLKRCNAVINTSISCLDSSNEINYRLGIFRLLKENGVRSVLRIVSIKPGQTFKGKYYNYIQTKLFKNTPIIDNPLRIPKSDKRVKSGDILVEIRHDLDSRQSVSLDNSCAFIGPCHLCPDQCGVDFKKIWIGGFKMTKKDQGRLFSSKYNQGAGSQLSMFTDRIEFEYVKSVIGSGYEEDVAKLAIVDKVAYRAARKNMQIHSAIILKINGEFSGFFTFQVNHEAKEFCLLQSAMDLNCKNKIIYQEMVNKIIEQNTYGYPMIMTVSTKHDLERPSVFEEMGFKTYLKLSGFEYMVYGDFADIRIKRLAHATMTNTWNSIKGDWLRMKKEWNEKIDAAGEKYNIPNPRLASREGCWQGKNGFSNVVLSTRVVKDGKVKKTKGRSHNLNASVLDPVACECILRFFMPINGKRVYNPFGGGVQMGFVAGDYGYQYIASEIRKNQCDCNNAICQDFKSVKWIQSDSAVYHPKGKFDLIFTCPPYYRVEKYIDYDGDSPEGEINSMSTYDQFRTTLFAGYKLAIEHLNEDCFFVVMVGDSRGPNGAYWGCESETELFFKEQGLYIYNKIVYLESEFTRLAQAKKTLDYRKFPKREQKIIVAYKGDMKRIKSLFASVGRL